MSEEKMTFLSIDYATLEARAFCCFYHNMTDVFVLVGICTVPFDDMETTISKAFLPYDNGYGYTCYTFIDTGYLTGV